MPGISVQSIGYLTANFDLLDKGGFIGLIEVNSTYCPTLWSTDDSGEVHA